MDQIKGEMQASLHASLLEYDGKATSVLGEAEAAFAHDDAYLDALIALLAADEGQIANGASWLLKSALENGQALFATQVERLVAQVPALADWPAQLHICQSIRFLVVPAGAADPLAKWLKGLLGHDRAFVRAWSLDGLGLVAHAYPHHSEVFNTALRAARDDAAASVRARARHLMFV